MSTLASMFLLSLWLVPAQNSAPQIADLARPFVIRYDRGSRQECAFQEDVMQTRAAVAWKAAIKYYGIERPHRKADDCCAIEGRRDDA